jgi:hypothetical protein
VKVRGPRLINFIPFLSITFGAPFFSFLLYLSTNAYLVDMYTLARVCISPCRPALMGEIPTHFHPVPKQIIHVSISSHPIPNQLRPNPSNPFCLGLPNQLRPNKPSQPILSRVAMESAVVGCHGFESTAEHAQ